MRERYLVKVCMFPLIQKINGNCTACRLKVQVNTMELHQKDRCVDVKSLPQKFEKQTDLCNRELFLKRAESEGEIGGEVMYVSFASKNEWKCTACR